MLNEQEKNNLEKLVTELDKIFVDNEKICEEGINGWDAIDRLTEINTKIAEIMCLLPK